MWSELKPDLMLQIAEWLQTDRDIYALCRTNKSFFHHLEHFLYQHNARYSASSALLWAAKHGQLNTAKASLDAGGDMETRNGDFDTPLLIAVQNNQVDIVCFFLDVDDVDVNITNIFGQTPLIRAAVAGNRTITKLLIESGRADVNIQDVEGYSALAFTSLFGSNEVADILVGHDQTVVDVQGPSLRTPLSIACERGQLEVVSGIISSGRADINARDADNRTPLMDAAEFGSYDVVSLLLSIDEIRPDLEDDDNETAFWKACKAGHMEVAALFMESPKFDPDVADVNGMTTLALAAASGDDAMVQILISSNRVNPNSRNSYGQTPLMAAVQSRRLETVQLLVGSGNISLDLEGEEGETAFLIACEEGVVDVAQYFLHLEGIDYTKKLRNGASALALAAADDSVELVQILLSLDAMVDDYDNEGMTALSRAATCGYLDCIRELVIIGGADPNVRNSAERTPLMLSAQSGKLEVVRFLLSLPHIDSGATGPGGRTAMHFASEHLGECRNMCNKQIDILKLLVGAGLSLATKDNTGRTPLHWAAFRGCYDTVVYLVYRSRTVDAEDHNGRTALFYASMQGNADIISVLARRSSKRTKTDIFGNLPVFVALRNGHDRALNELFSLNPSLVFSTDKDGRSLKYWAVRGKNSRLMEVIRHRARREEGQNRCVIMEHHPPQSESGSPPASPMPCMAGCCWCHVCCRGINHELKNYNCESCDSGGFTICAECHDAGAGCRDKGHARTAHHCLP